MSAELSGEADPGFVDAVARRVVELLREEGAVSREGPRLLTVAAVSQEFGVRRIGCTPTPDALARSGSDRARGRDCASIVPRSPIASRTSRHTVRGTARRSAASVGAGRGRGRAATSFRSSGSGA